LSAQGGNQEQGTVEVMSADLAPVEQHADQSATAPAKTEAEAGQAPLREPLPEAEGIQKGMLGATGHPMPQWQELHGEAGIKPA
jgi:hypothetical protein